MSSEEKEIISFIDKVRQLDQGYSDIVKRLETLEKWKTLADFKDKLTESIVSEVIKQLRNRLTDIEKSKLGLV